MSWWQGLILGIVQGLTEFLPVSSSGHLVVTQAAIGLEIPGVQVEVLLHLATLIAVLIVYRNTVVRLTRGAFSGDRAAWTYIGLLVIATIPAAVAGFWLADFFESAFDSLVAVGVDFLVTGGILWSTKWAGVTRKQSLNAQEASSIGVAQALAILPGISRSGTTVSLALWLGIKPEAAAEFSFLMAVPVIAGAAVLLLPDMMSEGPGMLNGGLAVSFLAALVSGVFAIRLLVALLRRQAFYRFAPYCWALGVLTITWGLMG